MADTETNPIAAAIRALERIAASPFCSGKILHTDICGRGIATGALDGLRTYDITRDTGMVEAADQAVNDAYARLSFRPGDDVRAVLRVVATRMGLKP